MTVASACAYRERSSSVDYPRLRADPETNKKCYSVYPVQDYGTFRWLRMKIPIATFYTMNAATVFNLRYATTTTLLGTL